MSGIMMLAHPDWLAYHERNSVGGLAIYYGSPHRWTQRNDLDPLFCVHRGTLPRSIIAVGRIRAQPIIDQNAAWARYGRALGADTETEWLAQAEAVLMNSRKTYGGRMLAIELIDFRPFQAPIPPDAVGLTDTGWSEKKEIGIDVVRGLLGFLA